MIDIKELIETEDKIKQTKSKRIGRPKKEVKNSKKIATYVSQTEYNIIVNYLEDQNITISQFIKLAVFEKLKKEIKLNYS